MKKLTREEAIRGAARVLIEIAVRVAQEDAERAHALPTPDPERLAAKQPDVDR